MAQSQMAQSQSDQSQWLAHDSEPDSLGTTPCLPNRLCGDGVRQIHEECDGGPYGGPFCTSNCQRLDRVDIVGTGPLGLGSRPLDACNDHGDFVPTLDGWVTHLRLQHDLWAVTCHYDSFSLRVEDVATFVAPEDGIYKVTTTNDESAGYVNVQVHSECGETLDIEGICLGNYNFFSNTNRPLKVELNEGQGVRLVASRHMSCDPAHCSTDVTMTVQKVETEAAPILTYADVFLWPEFLSGEYALLGFEVTLEIMLELVEPIETWQTHMLFTKNQIPQLPASLSIYSSSPEVFHWYPDELHNQYLNSDETVYIAISDEQGNFSNWSETFIDTHNYVIERRWLDEVLQPVSGIVYMNEGDGHMSIKINGIHDPEAETKWDMLLTTYSAENGNDITFSTGSASPAYVYDYVIEARDEQFILRAHDQWYITTFPETPVKATLQFVNYDSLSDMITVDVVTTPGQCGDGVISLAEECDDANTSNEDTCTNTCRINFCGDGYTLRGVEECDDANDNERDDCTAECRLTTCGDGILHETREVCDDGNRSDEDECSTFDRRLPQ